jgi:glycosyltransferase involved in cell wall biosynthesis
MHVPRHLLWVDRAAYKFADAVVVSSRNVEMQFRRFYGTGPAVHVHPHATDASTIHTNRVDARAAFGIAEQAFCVGFVGRLDPCKDLPFLVEAFARTDLDPADRLLILGTGPDEARVKQMASQRGLTNQIVWAGRVDEPATAYSAMDVLVLPSVYEAFGLVLLEAMAAGLPVVGRADDGETVFTATSDIVSEESGFVIPANGCPALVEVLRFLKRNPDRRREMGQAARRRALSRTWDDMARECIAVATAP